MGEQNSKKEKTIHISITGAKVLAVVLIAALWSASLWLVWRSAEKKFAIQYQAEEGSLYPYLNPRLRNFSQEERMSRAFPTLIPLRDKLVPFIGDKKENVAFYVEDLNSGAWTGWQEKEEFIPASLLKVPIAITVMKKIDDGNWSLDKTLELKAIYKDKKFGNLWQEKDGTNFTIKRLLDEMLKNSDDTATNILFDNMSSEERDSVYYHIGIANPEIQNDEHPGLISFVNLTPRNVATFFRALYNATFISRESSNYLLEILTDTNFDKLVRESIPADVKIAHKIGVFIDDPNVPKNFHDCGIAFIPKHPYLYCVMTKDIEPQEAEQTISGAEKIIYDHFMASSGNN